MYTSASGNVGIESTPLARIGYHDELITLVWERDFIPQITNTSVSERVLECNQEIQFTRQPYVGPWRTHEKGQQLIADQLTPEAFCMRICNSKYKAIEVTKQDIRMACDRWPQFESAFKESTYQSLTEEWRTWVFNGMIAEAHYQNKGNNAGKRMNIDLGQTGAPMVVTPDNIIQELSKLRRILRDQHRWRDNEMFVVLPTDVYSVLLASPVAYSNWMGDCVPCSAMIDGFLPKQLVGFNVIETSHSPVVQDPTGKLAYYIIAGHADAFAFAADIVEGRLVEMTDAFSIQYQMQAVWGGKAILPEALTIGYWVIG